MLLHQDRKTPIFNPITAALTINLSLKFPCAASCLAVGTLSIKMSQST